MTRAAPPAGETAVLAHDSQAGTQCVASASETSPAARKPAMLV